MTKSLLLLRQLKYIPIFLIFELTKIDGKVKKKEPLYLESKNTKLRIKNALNFKLFFKFIKWQPYWLFKA